MGSHPLAHEKAERTSFGVVHGAQGIPESPITAGAGDSRYGWGVSCNRLRVVLDSSGIFISQATACAVIPQAQNTGKNPSPILFSFTIGVLPIAPNMFSKIIRYLFCLLILKV